MLMFDRIAAVLVTAWFMAGLWLIFQAVRLPARLAADRDGEPE